MNNYSSSGLLLGPFRTQKTAQYFEMLNVIILKVLFNLMIWILCYSTRLE